MRVFITGASGFIGLALVKELIQSGHSVLGLARSDASAKLVEQAGAKVQRGSLDDLDVLRDGATTCDAVVHLAFNHDFSKFVENCEQDRLAIEALGGALEGTNKPMIVTGGVGFLAPGRTATEDDDPSLGAKEFPRVSEQTALKFNEKGVRASVMRLPQVHDREKAGLITYFVEIAKQKGLAGYIGEGKNCYPAVHVSDAANLYRLALEYTGPLKKFHAIAEEGIPTKDITEVVGQKLNLPVASIPQDKAFEHFGTMAAFAGLDSVASSSKTQSELKWKPVGPTLMEDLAY